jgi:hypothetical protein
MPSLGELRMSEWRAVPTLAVRAPRVLALRIRRLYNERGVVEASKCCRAKFLSELFEGVSEGVHS